MGVILFVTAVKSAISLAYHLSGGAYFMRELPVTDTGKLKRIEVMEWMIINSQHSINAVDIA